MNLKIKHLIHKILKNVTLTNVIIVGVLSLLVKGTSFLKEMVIADNFGLSELLDTYYIAILVPSFISSVFLGSFKSVFIPNYISELKTGKSIGSFQSTSLLVTILVTIVFIIVAVLFTDVFLEKFYDGHTQQYYSLVKIQFRYIAPCILFWGFSSLLYGILTIDNEFTLSTLSSIFTPIVMMICLFFFKEELGVKVLAVGTLIGSIVSFCFLLIVALRRKVVILKTPDFKSDNIREVFKQLPAKLSAGILSGVNPLIDQYFSAQLIIGSIAALNYGIKIPVFTIGIIGSALGDVLLPYFSKNAVENRYRTYIKLKKLLKIIVFWSIIVVIILVLLSHPIISLIFERNAFTSADTIVVSKIQQMYLLQIPSYITGLIMVKFLISINKNNFMVWASGLSLILNVTFNYILMKKMGVYGLALATSLVSLINSIILYIYINRLNHEHV